MRQGRDATTVTTTMERRKFVIGAGALATGSAAALGTGAFSSVEADRDFTVKVAEDANAYLGLEPGSGPTANEIVDDGGDIVELDFGDLGHGDGINKRATTVFEDVLRVTNQGTNKVYLWTLAPQSGDGSDRADRTRLFVNTGSDLGADDDGNDISQAGEAVELGSGEHVEITFEFETKEGTRVGEFEAPKIIRADVDDPGSDVSNWEEGIDGSQDPYQG